MARRVLNCNAILDLFLNIFLALAKMYMFIYIHIEIQNNFILKDANNAVFFIIQAGIIIYQIATKTLFCV